MKVINKLNTKNLEALHVRNDGSVSLIYRKKDKESGKDIDWVDHLTETKIRIVESRSKHVDCNYSHLCFFKEVAKLLKYVTSIEIFWKNNMDDSPLAQLGITQTTIILNLSDGSSVSFDELTHKDRTYPIKSGRISIVK